MSKDRYIRINQQKKLPECVNHKTDSFKTETVIKDCFRKPVSTDYLSLFFIAILRQTASPPQRTAIAKIIKTIAPALILFPLR